MPLAKMRTMVFVSPNPLNAGELMLVMLSIGELPGQPELSLESSRLSWVGASGAMLSAISISGTDICERPDFGADAPLTSFCGSKMVTDAVMLLRNPK